VRCRPPFFSPRTKAAQQWCGRERTGPRFAVPEASGVAEGFAAPITWNVEHKKNVRWKTAIPGLGHSSPIIWGDRIFVTTALSGKPNPELKTGLYGDIAPVQDDTVHQWKVYCLDKKTGRVLWAKVARAGVPRIKRHTKATHANSTMATDGKNVVAFFGSEGLYCYDTNGNLRWKKDLGLLDSGFFAVPEAQWGFASSPVLYNNKVLVQCDVQKGSFVAAFDVANGREIWRTPAPTCPRGARRPCFAAATGALPKSSSTAGNTSAATTPRPARSCGG
jgi:outer membrane protein assembly factor BamB